MNIFQQILNVSGFGIGLLDKSHTLLYANTYLQTLLNNAQVPVIGEDVYSVLALTATQSKEIRAQLETDSFWEGIISWSENAVKAKISRIEIPPSQSGPNFEETCFMLVLSDYSDELNQQRELSNAKRLAEKSEKVKSEFLSNMSHGLRTPLNAILGFSQLMAIDPTLSEEQQDNLKEITLASNSLLALINETFELSTTEPGKLKFTNERVELKELFAECISLLSTLAEKRKVTLLYNKKCNNTLAVDRVHLKQILMNLLSNAIRFNKPGGEVLIQSVPVSGKTMHIEVLDSGKGIAPQFIHSIFSPFKRINLKQNKIDNSGLGLMLTRHLVKMMHGKIHALSELDRGSIFWLELPREINYSNSVITSNKKKVLWLGSGENAAFAQHLVKIRPDLEFQQIQNPTDLTSISQDFLPDIIFLTIAEPDSPIQHCQRLYSLLKNDNSLKDIPVIAVVSSKSCLKSQDKASLPTTRYIDKPLNIIEFIKTIDHYLYT